MLGVLLASLAGIAIDPRTVTGVPAWLKPAKFAASIAIFVLTLAWAFTYLPEWRQTRRLVSRVTVATMGIEIALISLQASRGTTSHFNVATPFDLTVWVVMGSAIVVQTLASVAVAAALWRQSFSDPALGWGLRLGLSISILGAAAGGLMTRPTASQLDALGATGTMEVAGAHTVGAPDGGPGLPGTGWSVTHGDLRIPHFLGLHAFQVLPLVALGLRRRFSSAPVRVRLTLAAACSYTGLFGILLWQALRAQSLVRPDAGTAGALAAWAALTVALVALTSRGIAKESAHVTR
jgi:hypothetical protein